MAAGGPLVMGACWCLCNGCYLLVPCAGVFLLAKSASREDAFTILSCNHHFWVQHWLHGAPSECRTRWMYAHDLLSAGELSRNIMT
jgi:hypothetical protein